MPKIVKTLKGELIDFDLLKIKQEIGSAPAPIKVAERKNFIDNKLQRRIRRAKTELQQNTDKRNALVDIKTVDEDQPVVRPVVKNDD